MTLRDVATYGSGVTLMGSLSIWDWITVIVFVASPILGIVRGIKNGAAIHAIVSAFVPVYGLMYFLTGKQPGRTS
jgi:hypothetical protein